MLLNLILFLLFAAAFAMLFNQGLWSNLITLVNVITAGLIATSLFEPLADWLDGQMPSYTYLWDFVALWLVFAVSMAILRAATDFISRTQVRFKHPVNLVGGIFVALWIGWVMVCFTAMTLHTAPLGRSFLAGSFQPTPTSRMVFGLAPDQRWIAFAHMVSGGSLSTSPPEGREDLETNQFDPDGEFIFRYAERRARFESSPEVRVAP